MLALQLAKLLELNGKTGSVVLIDGSPQFICNFSNSVIPDKSEDKIQDIVLLHCMKIFAPEEFATFASEITAHKSWEAKIEIMKELTRSKHQYSDEYGRKKLKALTNRLKMSLGADKFKLEKLTSSLLLIKTVVTIVENLDNDYGLGQFSLRAVNIKSVEGNHTSVLQNLGTTELINAFN